MQNQLISVAKLGIGPIKNVLPAQTTGFSTQMESVFLYQTNAKLLMLMVLAQLATKAMMSLKENVYTHHQTKLDQLIWDAELGIGIDKFA